MSDITLQRSIFEYDFRQARANNPLSKQEKEEPITVRPQNKRHHSYYGKGNYPFEMIMPKRAKQIQWLNAHGWLKLEEKYLAIINAAEKLCSSGLGMHIFISNLPEGASIWHDQRDGTAIVVRADLSLHLVELS